MKERTYIAIDLKSFYASVECVELGMDPLDANLVVADESRTDKTICLAVSPALKQLGIPGRTRLFEVREKIKDANASRRRQSGNKRFYGSSVLRSELDSNPQLAIDFHIAKPRMALYMEYSTRIYDIYLRYIAPEDIHVYSIDEVFIDATDYLSMYSLSSREFACKLIHTILKETGITATAGIGTNLYLAKIAMDIMAKKIKSDPNGVRIATLDEMSYRRELWSHRPLTDFWRIGRGYAKKLEAHRLYTMGDIARCSIGKDSDYYNEDLLYKLFGINAELLIDHAWGREPCTMSDIKRYKPDNNSLGSGQVLQQPYTFDKARIVLREMVDSLSLDLVDKNLVTEQIVMHIGYDIENIDQGYDGDIHIDRYGRSMPKGARGSTHLQSPTFSSMLLAKAADALFCRIVNPKLLVRKLYITACNIRSANERYQIRDLFDDKEERGVDLEKEEKLQRISLSIKKKYGKNAILKGTSFEDGATGRERNMQIGGHHA